MYAYRYFSLLVFVRVPYLTVLQYGTVLGRYPVLRIRIRMFLGRPDPHPDPLVTSTDPFIIKQK